MPIQFKNDGTVVVDTVQEAIAFETHRKGRKRPRSSRAPLPSGAGREAFYRALEGRGEAPTNARKVLALVRGRGDRGIGLDELAKHMSWPPISVGRTLAGVTRRAARYGLDPADILHRGADGHWRPGPILRDHESPMP